MREPSAKDVDKIEILEKCFNYLCDYGLEQVSVRKLCDRTNMGAGSIYYWFKNKDEVILDATEYGINNLIDELMDFAYEHIDNINLLCDEFPKMIEQRIDKLKVIIRVATSPMYCDSLNLYSKTFTYKYDSYARKLSQRINLPYNMIRVLVDNFVSVTIDCIIWEDWGKYKRQLEYILEGLKLATIKKEKEEIERRNKYNWFTTGTDL